MLGNVHQADLWLLEPGNQPSAPAVTAHPPSFALSAPPVTGGRSGEVPSAPCFTRVSQQSSAGRALSPAESRRDPEKPQCHSSTPGQVPTGPSVQGNRPLPSVATAPLPGHAARAGPARAEPGRRVSAPLQVIQTRDNQLNQQIGGPGRRLVGRRTRCGLGDPAEFILRYARITRAWVRWLRRSRTSATNS